MAGAPSHLELFDNKPQLAKFDGTLPPAELLKGYRAAFINPNSKLLGPKFKFAKHGQCGAELSELLPHLAEVVDDIAIVKSMVTDAFNHAPGQILMSTGSQQFGKPSLVLGRCMVWAAKRKTCRASSYSAPAKKAPAAAIRIGAAAFCRPCIRASRSARAAIRCCTCRTPAASMIHCSASRSMPSMRLNRQHLAEVGDPEIATRINSFEMAYRMQAQAPEAIDISKEPEHILKMYGAEPGKPSFAATCLLARRLVERGVRFVEIFHEAWDQHGNLAHDIKENCVYTDQACAALLKDLKQRGLLDETLVIWGGEFGRTPMVQGGGNDGRDHHPNCFTMWLAGGGIKPGVTLGESDDFGFNATKDRVHVHDLHATILHLLGFDPARFSYKFQGLDQRLIGVEPARIVKELLA